MSAYWIFFAIEIVFVLGARYLGFKNRLIVLVPAIVLAAMFSGLRGNVGTDTYSYRFFYNHFHDADQLAFEPLFSAIALLGGAFDLSDQFFLVCISTIQAGFLILLIRHLPSRDLFFLFYLATYYISFQFNLIRFGTAILIAGLACILSLRTSQVWSRIFYFIGLASHFSMILCTPFLKLRKRNVVLVVSFMLVVTVLVFPLLQVKFEDLSTQGCLNAGWVPTFGVGFIFEMLICYAIVLKQGRSMDMRLIAALLGYVVFRLAGCAIPGGDRISMLFGFLFYLFLFAGRLTSVARILFVILAIYNFYGTIMFLQESDQAMQILISERSDLSVYEKTQWLPYRFFWQDGSVVDSSVVDN